MMLLILPSSMPLVAVVLNATMAWPSTSAFAFPLGLLACSARSLPKRSALFREAATLPSLGVHAFANGMRMTTRGAESELQPRGGGLPDALSPPRRKGPYHHLQVRRVWISRRDGGKDVRQAPTNR